MDRVTVALVAFVGERNNLLHQTTLEQPRLYLRQLSSKRVARADGVKLVRRRFITKTGDMIVHRAAICDVERRWREWPRKLRQSLQHAQGESRADGRFEQ